MAQTRQSDLGERRAGGRARRKHYGRGADQIVRPARRERIAAVGFRARAEADRQVVAQPPRQRGDVLCSPALELELQLVQWLRAAPGRDLAAVERELDVAVVQAH